MFLLVFSLWVCYLLAFGWLIWMQLYLGAHLHDVWACLPLAFFLFCLALHVRGSLVSLLVCLITCLPFPLCDNMLALLALCHLVWPSLLACIFARLFISSCMCLCMLVHVIKPSSYLWFHASSHPSLYTKSQVPLGIFLDVTCVIHTLI